MKKKDNYDLIMDYIFKVFIFILQNFFKYVKRTLLNCGQFKKILQTKTIKSIYLISIIACILIVWVYKLHPVLYFFSLFIYFGVYTILQDIKYWKKRQGIKRLNKKYKKVCELFDNKIDVISVKKEMITIYSNTLTEKEINSKFSKLELFFNRKISEIRQQEKNLRYIDIIFKTKTKFKSTYYLQQYIDYVSIDKKSILPFILGIDEKENIHLADMAKLNHLFISGESDTGKSVLLNQIIQSLMVFNSSMIEFILVDLKECIELFDYHEFKNCLLISNMTELQKIIEYLEKEMIKRLNHIKLSTGCKNIIQYNKKNSEKLHYVVIVIDEFATIKLENGEMKNLENKILSLLQKGRAAGIYLIGATQRPSSNQINTDVRAGFLYNISLRVKTKETQRMTKITGTEGLKVGEFKSDIISDTLKSFYIDEDFYNGVFENLTHRLVHEKEFIFIKDKEMKRLSLYKRTCNYIDTKIYKRRILECTKRYDYRHYIKAIPDKIIKEIEAIKEMYSIGQNNPEFDTLIHQDDYSKFIDYIFRENKENGLLPSSKEIEKKLNLTRSTRLKLLKRAIDDGLIDNSIKNKPKIIIRKGNEIE